MVMCDGDTSCWSHSCCLFTATHCERRLLPHTCPPATLLPQRAGRGARLRVAVEAAEQKVVEERGAGADLRVSPHRLTHSFLEQTVVEQPLWTVSGTGERAISRLALGCISAMSAVSGMGGSVLCTMR